MPPPGRIASVNSGCLRGLDVRNLTLCLLSAALPFIIKCVLVGKDGRVKKIAWVEKPMTDVRWPFSAMLLETYGL